MWRFIFCYMRLYLSPHSATTIVRRGGQCGGVNVLHSPGPLRRRYSRWRPRPAARREAAVGASNMTIAAARRPKIARHRTSPAPAIEKRIVKEAREIIASVDDRALSDIALRWRLPRPGEKEGRRGRRDHRRVDRVKWPARTYIARRLSSSARSRQRQSCPSAPRIGWWLTMRREVAWRRGQLVVPAYLPSRRVHLLIVAIFREISIKASHFSKWPAVSRGSRAARLWHFGGEEMARNFGSDGERDLCWPCNRAARRETFHHVANRAANI